MRGLLWCVGFAALAATGVAQSPNVPLRATLMDGGLSPQFVVNQPAYVAVFEVLRGAVVQQIFPRSAAQADRLVAPGVHVLLRPLGATDVTVFSGQASALVVPIPVVDARGRVRTYYYATAWRASPRAAYVTPPRTLLLVASRFPLQRVRDPYQAHAWTSVDDDRDFPMDLMGDAWAAQLLDDVVAAVAPIGGLPEEMATDILQIPGSAWPAWGNVPVRLSCGGDLVLSSFEVFVWDGVYRCPRDDVYAGAWTTRWFRAPHDRWMPPRGDPNDRFPNDRGRNGGAGGRGDLGRPGDDRPGDDRPFGGRSNDGRRPEGRPDDPRPGAPHPLPIEPPRATRPDRRAIPRPADPPVGPTAPKAVPGPLPTVPPIDRSGRRAEPRPAGPPLDPAERATRSPRPVPVPMPLPTPRPTLIPTPRQALPVTPPPPHTDSSPRSGTKRPAAPGVPDGDGATPGRPEPIRP